MGQKVYFDAPIWRQGNDICADTKQNIVLVEIWEQQVFVLSRVVTFITSQHLDSFI